MHAGLFCHSWRSGNYGDFVAKINMGAARGCFINLTKLHLTLSQSQLTLEYLGCAWVVFSDYYGQKEMFSLDADYLAMRLVVIKDN